MDQIDEVPALLPTNFIWAGQWWAASPFSFARQIPFFFLLTSLKSSGESKFQLMNPNVLDAD
jgi:hypothetical protein